MLLRLATLSQPDLRLWSLEICERGADCIDAHSCVNFLQANNTLLQGAWGEKRVIASFSSLQMKEEINFLVLHQKLAL
jgi:hypothetical protein